MILKHFLHFGCLYIESAFKGVRKLTENQLESYISMFRANIYRLSFSYVKNNEDAEDITQEAFLKLYTAKESFNSPENVKAWLIRVTINLSKNLIKTSWRQRRTELNNEIPVYNGREEVLVDFINKLKPEYSVVLHLYYYEGYSAKEIAWLCRIPSATVRTRLVRARSQLKEMLLKEGYNEKGIY